jgi:plastocyanin
MPRPPLLALVAAVLLAACSSTALGFDQPPASLDPSSPTIGAEGVSFDRAQLQVPANRPFILVFQNREAVGHNISIYRDSANGDRLFEGVVFSGPGTRWYPVSALTPGAYTFVCDIHPSMTGTLTAT